MIRSAFYLFILFAISTSAFAQTAKPRHGLSVFGDLKYPADFRNFGYVNSSAPKGGRIKVPGLDTFETIHPFILKGQKELFAEPLLYDTLMARSFDEPDSYYGLVAQSVEVPPDRSWVAFNIDPRARFHDSTPIKSALKPRKGTSATSAGVGTSPAAAVTSATRCAPSTSMTSRRTSCTMTTAEGAPPSRR